MTRPAWPRHGPLPRGIRPNRIFNGTIGGLSIYRNAPDADETASRASARQLLHHHGRPALQGITLQRDLRDPPEKVVYLHRNRKQKTLHQVTTQ